MAITEIIVSDESVRSSYSQNEESVRSSYSQNEERRAEDLKFTCCNIVIAVVTISLFYFDLEADIILMKTYYYEGHYTFFGLTMMFIVVPSTFISIFSMIWYCSDDAIEAVPTVSRITWTMRIIFHLLLMAPAWRAVETLYFGLKSWTRSDHARYYAYRPKFNNTLNLLKLLEAYLESAPQLVLQVSIIIIEGQERNTTEKEQVSNITGVNDTTTSLMFPTTELAPNVTVDTDDFIFLVTDFYKRSHKLIQLVVVCITTLSLTISLTTSTRRIHKNKLFLELFFFCVRFLFIMGRVLTLAAFASVFPMFWILPVVFLRWSFVMVLLFATRMRHSGCFRRSFYLVFGFVYLFAFVRLKNERTGKKYWFYFWYDTIEYVTLLVVTFSYGDRSTLIYKWYFIFVLLFSLSSRCVYPIVHCIYICKLYPKRVILCEFYAFHLKPMFYSLKESAKDGKRKGLEIVVETQTLNDYKLHL